MDLFLEAINYPAKAFKRHSKAVSWGFVIAAVLINAALQPVLGLFSRSGNHGLDILQMLKVIAFGIASYVIVSFTFYAVCRCLGSKESFKNYLNSWGVSFLPTIICSIVVAVTEEFFYVFWNNSIWGMILNIVFVTILIWKTILYFIYLKDFAQLRGWRVIIAAVIIGVFIIIYACLDGYLGVKTPVI